MPRGSKLPWGRSKSADPWTEDSLRHLTREWKRGTIAKVIGLNLEPSRSERAVITKAYSLGLPRRQLKGTRTPGWQGVHISLKEPILSKARNRAFAEGITFSSYVARLINRDLGDLY